MLDEVIVDRERYFIHVDGALFAQILPHLDGAQGQVPIHDFTRPISSLSVSGHKMMGCPMPSGVVVHRRQNIKVRGAAANEQMMFLRLTLVAVDSASRSELSI